MAFLPVGNGRVPFSLSSHMVLENISLRQRDLARVAAELSSGRKIQLPSDSPFEAIRASTLQRANELSTQFRDNVRQAQSSLSFTDGLLSTFSDAIDSTIATVTQVLDGTRPDAELDAARIEIDATIDNLVSVANRQYLDRYTFATGKPSQPPFRRDGNHIVFTGDESVLNSLQGPLDPFAASVDANSAIGVFSKAGRGGALTVNIAGSTRLSTLNQGVGVEAGRIRVDAGVGSPVVVDLRNADSIQDVIDIVNNDATLSAQGVTIGINTAGNGLAVLAGPGANITMEEVEGGSTARDLGLAFNNAPIPAQGADLDPRMTLTTPLALLNGGAGIDGSVPIVIENGPHSASIDLSTATTVEDVLNRINAANVRVRASINAQGTGIDVVSALSGVGYSIVEGSLTGTAARDLGIRTTALSTRLGDFNEGGGVDLSPDEDIEITVGSGAVFAVDLGEADTLGDVKGVIESATSGVVTVEVNPLGGLRLIDNSGGAGGFAVRDINGSGTSADLGIEASVSGSEILGEHVTKGHVAGAFDTLLRIRDGLAAKDRATVTVAAQRLEDDQSRVSQSRGVLGGMLNSLQAFEARLTANMEQFTLDTTTLVDADLSETVAELALQQTALKAALASGAQLLQGSLLDFI